MRESGGRGCKRGEEEKWGYGAISPNTVYIAAHPLKLLHWFVASVMSLLQVILDVCCSWFAHLVIRSFFLFFAGRVPDHPTGLGSIHCGGYWRRPLQRHKLCRLLGAICEGPSGRQMFSAESEFPIFSKGKIKDKMQEEGGHNHLPIA